MVPAGYCVRIVFDAKLLPWQPWAKQERWELFSTHTALRSLLSNTPAVIKMKSFSGSNSGHVDLKWPGPRSLISNSASSCFVVFFNVFSLSKRQPAWASFSASPPTATSLSLTGMRTHRKWISQCPLWPVQMSPPKRPPGQWHSQADFVIILLMHVSLVCAKAECLCFLLLFSSSLSLSHTQNHTQPSSQLLAGIWECLGLHLKQFTGEIIAL